MEKKSKKIEQLNIVKTSIYNHVANIINKIPDVESVLDMGGIGRMQAYLKAPVTDANIKKGINGSNLPFKDNQFSITMSTATLEHVEKQQEFIDEAYRVAKIGTVHWFPAGIMASKAEQFRIDIDLNKHPCV